MIRGEPSDKFPRGAAADLWRHTLLRIPTTFGRLAYLASLRDQNTGAYQHHGLAQVFGEEESDRTLRESHEQTFAEWLCYPLEHQKTELDEYLSGLETPLRTVLETWVRYAPYRNFVPGMARETERQLYLADLEILLELLRREHGVAVPDPEA
ncbi:MAG: hypothetical protein ACE15B_12435 [Bryobacteraceae bacterium]